LTRKSSSTAVQEELYPLPRDVSEREASDREPFDDSRLIDLEAEQESPFLRGQKRVSVRRGSIPKKTANRLKWVALALVVFAVLGAFSAALYGYGKHSWRFRIDSSDQIEVSGSPHVSHAQIMEVMGGDIGRNIFFIPLTQRKHQLEQIPWVESASVMRFVPNHLRIEIHERTPVAFARIGSHISLIDAQGNLMELAPGGKHKYSFPVIDGMNAGEPLSMRAARMKNYNALMQQLDSGGAHYSQELSEVDLTDTEDVKVITADPNGEVLVHLGGANYLQRYKIYVAHVQAWRQQFTKLESVDLRYDGQIIVNPDLEGMPHQPALTQAAARAALAAGVKNAAIVNYEKFVTHPATPAPAAKQAQSKGKVAAKSEPKAEAKAESKASVKATPKAAPKVAQHHAASKAKPRQANGKNAVAPHASVRPVSGKPVQVTSNATDSAKSTSASSADVKPAKPAPQLGSSVPPSGQKKPSAAIPKETPHN
jgi:cell division protein FtsQ